jgi:2-keto-4-pentenoate hydratase/2-oxohepta-3-ene-1,7-dioic acid hydratase in catechol pathway
VRHLRYRDGTAVRSGVLAGDRIVPMGPHRGASTGTADLTVGRVTLVAPVEPVTVFGMAHNTGPDDRRRPPQAFLKAAASVVGPGAAIPLPAGIGRVDAEVELAVVIGDAVHRADPGTALESVLGYTIGLDITARGAQASDHLWTEAKSRTGFTPLGPWIETDLDPGDLRMSLTVNGRETATGTTADLARGVGPVLAYLSELVELRPGDVVLTGAPGTYAPITPGDTITAWIEHIGSLGASVVARPTPPVPAHLADTPP